MHQKLISSHSDCLPPHMSGGDKSTADVRQSPTHSAGTSAFVVCDSFLHFFNYRHVDVRAWWRCEHVCRAAPSRRGCGRVSPPGMMCPSWMCFCSVLVLFGVSESGRCPVGIHGESVRRAETPLKSVLELNNLLI